MSTVVSNFFELNPERVLAAAEEAGFHPTGEFYQLNSYENRVFDIVCENQERVIAKFYRPQRWSKEAILDEHNFLNELKSEGIPAVAPLEIRGSGSEAPSLLSWDGMWASFFPKVRGRLPQELITNDYIKVGHLLAQVHNIGSRKAAEHRLQLDETFPGAWLALDFLQDWLLPEISARYNLAAEKILEKFSQAVDPSQFIRIHGDAHRGNLLQGPSLQGEMQFFLVDFDDFLNGPAVQDFWMLFSGDQEQVENEKKLILKGYEELREFPDEQWDWVPLLQGVRIISYSHWIAKRWQDPSFPRLFPDFNSYKYWAEETEALEKIAWML